MLEKPANNMINYELIKLYKNNNPKKISILE